jgi:hypothetical protein
MAILVVILGRVELISITKIVIMEISAHRIINTQVQSVMVI